MSRKLLLLLLSQVIALQLAASFRLVTWNFRHLGASKSDVELIFAAGLLRSADVIALQEVVAGPEGIEAVSRLAGILVRSGESWDFAVSPPTQSPGGYAERYAFLWKPDRVQIVGEATLEEGLAHYLMREPFTARFRLEDRIVRMVNFHALPWDKGSEWEAPVISLFTRAYSGETMLLMGDFNLPDGHPAFHNLIAAGFRPVLRDQPTTLQRVDDGDGYLLSPFDNIWYDPATLELRTAAPVDFVPFLNGNLILANRISDHLPVAAEFEFSG